MASHVSRASVGGAIIVVLLGVLAVQHFSRASQPAQLAGVPEFTLVPATVAVPALRQQAGSHAAETEARYVIRNEGNAYQLYLADGDSYEKVIGPTPPLTASPDPNFRGFTDVLSPSGTTTYAAYVKYQGAPIDGVKLVASELYALKDNTIEQVLSNLDPAGIGSLDTRIPLGGAYLDWKGNLYVMTMDGTLCVIRDGRVVAKADVTKIGGHRPAIPSMFSDRNGTYFLVPKMLDQDNSMGGLGPKTEAQVRAKYKISLRG